MHKSLTPLLAGLALFVLPIAAPAACAQAQPSARAAAAYPIPPSSGASTPAAATRAAVGAAASYLASFSPAALAGKGAAELGATAPGAGTFTFVLTAKIHGKTVVIGRGSKATGAAGALTIKLTLTKAGKAALKGAKGKLKVTLAASFKPKQGKVATAKHTATLK